MFYLNILLNRCRIKCDMTNDDKKMSHSSRDPSFPHTQEFSPTLRHSRARGNPVITFFIQARTQRHSLTHSPSFPRRREPSNHIRHSSTHSTSFPHTHCHSREGGNPATLKPFMVLMLLITSLFCFNIKAEPESPNLGTEITTEELAPYKISVFPNGKRLPKGQGSVSEGKKIYQGKCQACHGEGGVGDSGEQLAGAIHSLTDEWPEKTIGTYWPYATTLFDFTRRSMPMTQPGTLSNNETYALVAYMLFLNKLLPEDAMMNAEALRNFELPNRNGFIDVYSLKNKK